ncbi:RUN domain-containing protein 1 [Trichostrongylus colubriformis]|uniref:RUN domain-containing protein 1 n=1 Tax=Trichostrongylus colubriformis TaxID=6319 RepID=A0AAN8J390_TRICO
MTRDVVTNDVDQYLINMAEPREGECIAGLEETLGSLKLEQCTNDDDADTTSDTDWRSARLSSSDDNCSSLNDALRVQQLEEEQERLNNSLFSLSSHFAQVQFRLKQIAEAKGEDREELLKNLQDFAFKGCADMNELKKLRSENEDGEVLEIQKQRQNELLKQLREQIEDLERIAYENGEGDMPSTLILQKQKAALDELHAKMSLNLELDKMSLGDIQKHVDDALKQLVNPFKEKQHLVEQLQTQIIDLERFVSYLQKENSSTDASPAKAISSSQFTSFASKPKSTSFFGLVGGSSQHFQKNQLKNTLRGNHYGDERARLQLAVDATLRVMEKYTLLNIESPSGNEELQELDLVSDEVFERSEEEVVSVVRRQLCPSLKALLEHGMLSETVTHRSLPSSLGFGCFVAKNGSTYTLVSLDSKATPLQHIWDVVLYFYDSRNGRELSEAPVRKLSQSFKLENVAGKSITSKQILLTTIENIVSTHARLRRSKDAQWKAFVSAAMNEKKLPAWLRIIFRTRHVVEMCYNSWSYVSRTVKISSLYDLYLVIIFWSALYTTITAIGGSSSVVFLGTNHGRVIHLKKKETRFRVAGSFELPTVR